MLLIQHIWKCDPICKVGPGDKGGQNDKDFRTIRALGGSYHLPQMYFNLTRILFLATANLSQHVASTLHMFNVHVLMYT